MQHATKSYMLNMEMLAPMKAGPASKAPEAAGLYSQQRPFKAAPVGLCTATSTADLMNLLVRNHVGRDDAVRDAVGTGR